MYIIMQLARYKNVTTTQLHTYQKKGNPPFPSKEWQIALYYIRCKSVKSHFSPVKIYLRATLNQVHYQPIHVP